MAAFSLLACPELAFIDIGQANPRQSTPARIDAKLITRCGEVIGPVARPFGQPRQSGRRFPSSLSACGGSASTHRSAWDRRGVDLAGARWPAVAAALKSYQRAYSVVCRAIKSRSFAQGQRRVRRRFAEPPRDQMTWPRIPESGKRNGRGGWGAQTTCLEDCHTKAAATPMQNMIRKTDRRRYSSVEQRRLDQESAIF